MTRSFSPNAVLLTGFKGYEAYQVYVLAYFVAPSGKMGCTIMRSHNTNQATICA